MIMNGGSAEIKAYRIITHLGGCRSYGKKQDPVGLIPRLRLSAMHKSEHNNFRAALRGRLPLRTPSAHRLDGGQAVAMRSHGTAAPAGTNKRERGHER